MQRMSNSEFGGWLYEKRYIPTQLGLSSRIVSYWRSKELLPFMAKEKKGLMNIPEALWLLIVNDLMQIGLSTQKVKRLSDDIWIKPYLEKYADKVFQEKIDNPKSTLSEAEKKILSSHLQDELIMNTVLRREINPFTDAIKRCLKSNRELMAFIYSPKTDKHYFHSAGKALLLDLNNFINKDTIVSIPVTPLLSKLIGVDITMNKEDIIYLNAIENQIRRVLVYDNPKQIEIQLTEKGETKQWITTEQHKKAEELASFFLNNKLPLKSSVTIEPRSQGNYKITIKSLL